MKIFTPVLRGIKVDFTSATLVQERGRIPCVLSSHQQTSALKNVPSHRRFFLLRSYSVKKCNTDNSSRNSQRKCIVVSDVVKPISGYSAEEGTKVNAEDDEDYLPDLNAIISSASDRGIDLKISSFGPFFSITATATDKNESLEHGLVLGRIEGFVRPWIDGLVLHLDSVRMAKIESPTRSVFGVALRLGAAAVRFGYDKKCSRAELLAINDTDEYHTKLTRYYSRLGFRVVREVEGGRLGDMAHMLVWGGVGTRMDGDIKFLLRKWAKAINKQ